MKIKYAKNYIDVIKGEDGKDILSYNQIAYAAELRAISIKRNQYSTKYTVHNSLRSAGYTPPPTTNPMVTSFTQKFTALRSATERMKLYSETVESNPGLKKDLDALPIIPFSIKQAYNILGPNKLKACSYRFGVVQEEVNFYVKKDQIKEILKTLMTLNEYYDNGTLKVILANALINCGIRHKKISAADIVVFFPASVKSNFTDKKDRKRKWGWYVCE
jgi:hypothetical protein